ncbi:hypothetical protein DICPUDRAFT_89803 [Dictyostelium purpureum]|uniref:Uncharacterized protein n=1 Tax=Dictyostelium purpureum TaxID=5786 RepID=F0ZYA2_DICPU|nr:uncharacterized protein DICPUDRAFT_89803 [Dictyostelium purpureum]EGC31070.1 hypothetical protein DICPUDRAFT_89803 [Dictyostelium purpureum]|eukprot:XP_003292396.1 hypothetical protein DICPUDRAFT_89803 [Dictyostelium purpureum]
MNDEEFFKLLNQFPLRNENQTNSETQSQPQQQPNLFSIFNNIMGGLNRNTSTTTTTTTSSVNKEEEEFWKRLKSFLYKNINNQEEADTIYNNFKMNHEKFIKEKKNEN